MKKRSKGERRFEDDDDGVYGGGAFDIFNSMGDGEIETADQLRMKMTENKDINEQQLDLFDRVNAYYIDTYSPFFKAKFVEKNTEAILSSPLRLFVSGVGF